LPCQSDLGGGKRQVMLSVFWLGLLGSQRSWMRDPSPDANTIISLVSKSVHRSDGVATSARPLFFGIDKSRVCLLLGLEPSGSINSFLCFPSNLISSTISDKRVATEVNIQQELIITQSWACSPPFACDRDPSSLITVTGGFERLEPPGNTRGHSSRSAGIIPSISDQSHPLGLESTSPSLSIIQFYTLNTIYELDP